MMLCLWLCSSGFWLWIISQPGNVGGRTAQFHSSLLFHTLLPPCVSNDGETEAEMALAYPPRPAASDLCITASILITTNNQPSIGSAVPQLFLQARPEERCVGRWLGPALCPIPCNKMAECRRNGRRGAMVEYKNRNRWIEATMNIKSSST